MIACSPIRTCAKYIVRNRPSGSGQQTVMPSSACCFHLSLGCVKPSYVAKTNTRQSLIGSSDIANQRSNWQLLTIKSAMRSRLGTQKTRPDLSLGSRNMNLRLLFPKQGLISRMKWSLVPGSWTQGCASAGLVMGLIGCNLNTEPAHAEAKKNKEDENSSTITNFSHGKQVHTNYSVIGKNKISRDI